MKCTRICVWLLLLPVYVANLCQAPVFHPKTHARPPAVFGLFYRSSHNHQARSAYGLVLPTLVGQQKSDHTDGFWSLIPMIFAGRFRSAAAKGALLRAHGDNLPANREFCTCEPPHREIPTSLVSLSIVCRRIPMGFWLKCADWVLAESIADGFWLVIPMCYGQP